MRATDFKIGDCVNLRSGGPIMTVVAKLKSVYQVMWFDEKLSLLDAHVPGGALILEHARANTGAMKEAR